jgi:hypothetical protein
MEHFFQNTIGEDWFTYPNLYTFIPNYFGEGAVFVEVGVWKGRSICFLATEVVNQNKNQKVYGVDIWEFPPEYIPLSELANDTENKDWIYDIFLKNIEPVKDYIIPIRKPSLEAVNQFEDNSIDFVFIDAAHDYENVKNDILAWLPKIKKDGIIAGHDYTKNENDGVVKAVNEVFGIDKIEIVDDRTWMYNLKKHNNK